MSFSKSYMLERLIEGFIKTPTSLEKQAFDNVALRICHNWKLKQHIFFMKLELHEFLSAGQLTQKWQESILKESTEVCKTISLPNIMQQHLLSHIRKIAIQLLIWSGDWKAQFDISCHLTADLWMPNDWEDGRLNERKIAERIIRDKRISNYQRYKLSCMYCLEESIRVLWNKLSSRERYWLVWGEQGDIAKPEVIRMWSLSMLNPEAFTNSEALYVNLFCRGLADNSVVTVIYSWDKLSSITKQNLLAEPLALSEDIILFYDDELIQLEGRWDDSINKNVMLYIFYALHLHRRNILCSYRFMDNLNILLPLGRDYLETACFILSQIRELRLTGYQAQFKFSDYIIDSLLTWPSTDLQFTEYPASSLQITLKQLLKWQYFVF